MKKLQILINGKLKIEGKDFTYNRKIGEVTLFKSMKIKTVEYRYEPFPIR